MSGSARTAAAPHLLPAPAKYFPVRTGTYAMKVGLMRLGTDFGNGAADARLLQIDRHWPHFRDNKLTARAESLGKYYCVTEPFGAAARRAVCRRLLQALTHEYPALFRRHKDARGQWLQCDLSGEGLLFDSHGELLAADAATQAQPPYRDGLDALAGQLQEDLSFVSVAPAGQVQMLHLCAPNHWAAGDRIGRSFAGAHAPVPGFARITRQSAALLENLRDAGPYVRFAWGLASDQRLNHHPEPPPGWDPDAWRGRVFDPRRAALYLRVERQVLLGIPEANGFLFAIRTYFTDICRLDADRCRTLAAAVRGMSAEVARYKGLAQQQDAIAAWLDGRAARP